MKSASASPMNRRSTPRPVKMATGMTIDISRYAAPRALAILAPTIVAAANASAARTLAQAARLTGTSEWRTGAVAGLARRCTSTAVPTMSTTKAVHMAASRSDLVAPEIEPTVNALGGQWGLHCSRAVRTGGWTLVGWKG